MQNSSSHPAPPPPNLALPPGLAPPPGLSSLPPPAGPPPGIAPAAPPLEQAKDEKNGNSLVTIVKAQIVFLLSSINEDSFSSRVNDIRQLSDHHGPEIYHYFLRRLVNANAAALNSSANGPVPSGGNMVWRLMVLEGKRVARDVLLGSQFAQAIAKAEPTELFRSFSFTHFANRVSLTPSERLTFGAGILTPGASGVAGRILDQGRQLVQENFQASVEGLRAGPGGGWFDDETDLSPGMGTLLLSTLLSTSTVPILDGEQRRALLMAMTAKFSAGFLGSTINSLPLPLSGVSLPEFLCELGQGTADVQALRTLLARWWGGVDGLQEKSRSLIVGLAEVLAQGELGGVDAGAVVRALISLQDGDQQIDWASIIGSFSITPHPHILLVPAVLPLLLSLLALPPQTPSAPISAFFAAGSSYYAAHPLIVLQITELLLSLPQETFSLAIIPGLDKVVTPDDVPDVSPAWVGSGWNVKAVYDLLRRASEHQEDRIRERSQEILEGGMQTRLELIFLGLVQTPKPYSPVHAAILSRLLDMFFAHHTQNTVLFTRLWQTEPDVLREYFGRVYAASEMNLQSIVEVAEAVGAVGSLLSRKPFAFALDVAALAAKSEAVNLEQYLDDSIAANEDEFVEATLEFVGHKIVSELVRQDSDADAATVALSAPVVGTFLRVLTQAPLSDAQKATLADLRLRALQLYPRLLNLVPGSDAEHGFDVVAFSEETESEVDGIYRRMYDDADSVPVETVVTYLAAWRESADAQRQRIFACMLYTLLDEFKFFHTYPPRQLALTGQLFGALILRHLIDGIPLTVSLRYVTESLKSPPDAPASSFEFGFISLQTFQSRLAEFPEVCEAVVAIPHLHESHPHLIEFVRTTLADRDAERAKGHIGADGQVIVPIFKALRLDSFDLSEPLEEPDEDTSDRILFIVNNLAPSNFEAKVGDMREAFQARHSRWFAHYFIGSRVSVEPNNHALYLQFIEALDWSALEKHVLFETYSKTYTLLNSEKTVSQAQDRATLKNLGSWLGRLTLARDLPLRFNQLSLKDLLVEGYDAKRLIVAIPFVCKVLEQCARSKVFHPPNPWLMAVLRLLVELYHTAELKLNLKFEIEVLCKTLGIDLGQITPTTFIRDRPTEVPGVQTLTQDLERLSMAGGFGGAAGGEPGRSAVSVYQSEAAAAAAQAALNRKVDELIADLPAFLVFPPETVPFNSNATLKRIVFTAIERAIHEIVVPVVERSVTIAGISSRDLITKDFATEGDEGKMRKAAHAMVQNLAGNLAMVTSKDPLRSSISTSVRALLQQNGFNEASIPGDSVVAVVAANLDLAASVIKRAAQDKAIYDVDETLSAAFQLRQRHREQGGNQPFWDGTQPVVNVNILPDMLRVRPNGLLPQQMEVYDEFGKQKSPRSRPGVLNGADSKLQRPGVIDRLRGLPLGYRTPSPASEAMLESAAAAPTSLSSDQSLLKFQQIISDVDKYIGQSGVASLATLPQHHDLKMAIRQIPVIAAQSFNRDETALGFSQKIVQLLYKTDSVLGREVFVLVLQRLCELFPKVQKEVVNWLVYAEDERKFNVPVTVALVRAGLISMVEQDVQLAHFVLRDLRPAAINFTASFVRECLLGEQPCATRAQLANSLEALARAAQAGKASDNVIRLLEDIAGGAQGPGQPQETEVALRDRLAYYFLEWVRLFQQAPSAEQAFVSIVTNLQAQGILKGDEITFLFFRVCAEVAVEGYAKLKVADPVAALIPMDALSKIFILLLKNYGDPNGAEVDESKIRYLNKILSIVVLVLVRSHEELGPEFDQRPFFRFFSSILNDLHSIEPSIRTAYVGCLRAFSSNTLSMLQPTLLPGFAFSWMSLISHRLFMPKLLASPKEKSWPEYHGLLIALFKFLGPFLSAPKLQESSRALYKGTMRILLVLLHDFPDFLAEHYLSLAEALPAHCTQIRNVVLSAFPRNTTLPDPFTYDFELADAHKLLVPTVASDYVSIISEAHHAGFDHIAYSIEMVDLHVPEAMKKIVGGTGSDGQVRYNLPYLNAAVLSIGVGAVNYLMLSPGGVKVDWTFEAQRPSVAAIERIAAQLDNEGQYHLISSIVNNLRHPSAHTHWFSHLLLHLFGSPIGSSAAAGGPAAPLAEIIARVLLERVVVARPHPWGVLVTFIQMLRLPGFWNQEFVRRSRELEAMFKTCAA